MMEKINFLIFGKNEPILDILIRLVNSNEDWFAEGFNHNEKAKEYFQQNAIDIVLLSSGIDEENEKEICSFFIAQQPDIEIIQHYGGGSGLLKCEIMEALEKRKKIDKRPNTTSQNV